MELRLHVEDFHIGLVQVPGLLPSLFKLLSGDIWEDLLEIA